MRFRCGTPAIIAVYKIYANIFLILMIQQVPFYFKQGNNNNRSTTLVKAKMTERVSSESDRKATSNFSFSQTGFVRKHETGKAVLKVLQ